MSRRFPVFKALIALISLVGVYGVQRNLFGKQSAEDAKHEEGDSEDVPEKVAPGAKTLVYNEHVFRHSHFIIARDFSQRILSKFRLCMFVCYCATT